MSVRETVRDAQRRLAELDAAYARLSAELRYWRNRTGSSRSLKKRLIERSEGWLRQSVCSSRLVCSVLTQGKSAASSRQQDRCVTAAMPTQVGSSMEARTAVHTSPPAPSRGGQHRQRVDE